MEKKFFDREEKRSTGSAIDCSTVAHFSCTYLDFCQGKYYQNVME